MKLLHETIVDDLYPKSDTSHRVRNAVRAVIVNESNEIALIHVLGSDMFGNRDHYELPGGGIEDGETLEEALRREVIEEIGFLVENIHEMGTIAIEYNLLNRTDVQHYFVAKATKYVGSNLTESEKLLFNNVVYLPIEKIVENYEKYPVENIGINIHKRDLIAIKEALKLIDKGL